MISYARRSKIDKGSVIVANKVAGWCELEGFSLGRNVRRSWLRCRGTLFRAFFRFIDGYRPELGTVLLQVNDRWNFVHMCLLACSVTAQLKAPSHHVMNSLDDAEFQRS